MAGISIKDPLKVRQRGAVEDSRWKPKLPRAPIMKQTGSVHKTRRNELERKRKHKKDGIEQRTGDEVV